MGDFNCRIANDTRKMNTREQYIINAINLYNLKILTNTDSCCGPRFTFTPYGNGSNTFIDHIVVSELLSSNVVNCCVLEDAPLNVSRHFPIVFSLNAIKTFGNQLIHQNYQRTIYNGKIDSEIERYSESVTDNPQNSDINFTDPNKAYDIIVNCLNKAAEGNITKRTFCKHLKPYWSAELKELHKYMRKGRAIWIKDRKPRSNTESRQQYKSAKRAFRRLLRIKYSDYEREENELIDQLAEMDQKGFWKAVNTRKARTRVAQGSEIKFDSQTLKDPDSIVDGWKNYFAQLYSQSENADFDETFKVEIDQFVSNIITENDHTNRGAPILTQRLMEDELVAVMKVLPFRKSPSYDNITYEHVVYGGEYLKQCLLQLFQRFLETGTVPEKCKDGLIITLHKGRGKSFTDPNNYRAISLLPAVYKIFEKILQLRIENSLLPTKIHPHQHGFQKGKSCSMVTFILKECANYCIERGSDLYACFMDAEKAFDKVWLNGLLYKLYNIGITNSKDFYLLHDMFSCMKSRVLAHNLLSDWIMIEQGTRQGSLLSPFMYSVYLNDLHIELDQSGVGIRIGNKLFAAPTQADDIQLLSLTKNGIGILMCICWKYSCKWRFLYSCGDVGKSFVIVYSGKQDTSALNRTWKYGNSVIRETSQYKHLGSIQTKRMDYPGDVTNTIHTLRGTFLSLQSCGVHSNGLNPISSMKLYTSVVLPRALYGCELWSNVSRTSMLKLEVAHRFCLKFAQGLPKLTRTDIALGILGVSSLETYIGMRKLNFLGILCKSNPMFIVKFLFMTRLFQFQCNCTKSHRGFIPDIVRILNKYSLHTYLTDFISCGYFPSKLAWKNICKSAIWCREELQWKIRLSESSDFSRLCITNCNRQCFGK